MEKSNLELGNKTEEMDFFFYVLKLSIRKLSFHLVI